MKDLEKKYDRLKEINKKNSFIKEQFKKRIIDRVREIKKKTKKNRCKK